MSRGRAPWNVTWSPAEIRRAINQEKQNLSYMGDVHVANKSRAGESHDFKTCRFCQSIADEIKGMDRIRQRFGGRS